MICSINVQCSPCSSFPKIFGGNGGDTILNQIDVSGDYVAMGGNTNDISLIATNSSLPYVAVMS